MFAGAQMLSPVIEAGFDVERCRIGSMEHGLRNWVLEIIYLYFP